MCHSGVYLAVSGTSMVLAGKIPFKGLKCNLNEIIRLVKLYDATLIWSISACSYRRNINSDRQSGFQRYLRCVSKFHFSSGSFALIKGWQNPWFQIGHLYSFQMWQFFRSRVDTCPRIRVGTCHESRWGIWPFFKLSSLSKKEVAFSAHQ